MDDLLTGFFNEVSKAEKEVEKSTNKDDKDIKKNEEPTLLDNFTAALSF